MFLLALGQHLMKAFSAARLNVNSRDAPVMAYFARVCMPVLFLNCTRILLEVLLVGHLNNRRSTKDNHTLQSWEVPKTFRFDNALEGLTESQKAVLLTVVACYNRVTERKVNQARGAGGQ